MASSSSSSSPLCVREGERPPDTHMVSLEVEAHKKLQRAIHRLLPDSSWAAAAYRDILRTPLSHPPAEMRDLIMQSTRVRSLLQQLCAEGAGRIEDLTARGHKIITRMVGDPIDNVTRVFAYILRKLFTTLYSGVHVDMRGVEKLKENFGKGPLVLLPTHKSHLDYLVMSYVLLSCGMQVPFIAAGENMDIAVAGFFFRHSGAYFIRRSFADDELYKAILQEYLLILMREGNISEFFIEGTRSRSGKVLRPRMGMLSYIVDFVMKGELENAVMCPLAVQYEKVLEGETYSGELLGAKKEKESFGALLKATPGFLRRKFGSIHIRCVCVLFVVFSSS